MKGKMAVISGFSGTGKGTLVKRLIEKYSDDYVISVSRTTRKPRPGEVDGVDYFFTDRDDFKKLIDEGDFIEHAEFGGNFYGTPLTWVKEQMASGKNVILEIEVQGALQVKEKFPETKLLFVAPPNMHELVKRLEGRGSETKEEIKSRLEIARERECSLMDKYDYIVINDDIDTCVEDVRAMIAGRYEAKDMSGYIASVTKEISEILESGEF